MNSIESIPISGKTKIIPILADPIAQVQTPKFMNMLFQKANVDAVCIPFHVAAEDLNQTIQALRLIPTVAGAVVTTPHKINICALTDIQGAQAQIIAAMNAIRFDAQRQIHGEMFDGKGFVQGLIHSGFALGSHSRIYLAGAGGAARGIAFALLEQGVKSLQIYNRTQATAATLVQELQHYAPDAVIELADAQPQQVDLCVNATAAGMLGEFENSVAFELDGLAAGSYVADVIMNPLDTQLLQQAEKKGLKTISGQAMLFAQIGQLAAFILDEPRLAEVRL